MHCGKLHSPVAKRKGTARPKAAAPPKIAQTWRKLTGFRGREGRGTPAARKEVNLETSKERQDMLGWAVTFLIIALLAALLGFSGIAGTAVGLAKILFAVFLVLFLISVIFGRRHA
jgi:uncharacterized membrane protein YtjA (UPF0391 family)